MGYWGKNYYGDEVWLRGSAAKDKVCNGWATQSGKHRNGKNIFYEGDTIYSHGEHYPLGRIVGNVAYINHRPWESTTRNGRVIKDSPSTKRNRDEAWRGARRAGLITVASLDVKAAHLLSDVMGFCDLALSELGYRHPCTSEPRLYAAMHWLKTAKATAKAMRDIAPTDYAEARALIAKAMLEIRAGHNKRRTRDFKRAFPYAATIALGVYGSMICEILHRGMLEFRLKDGRKLILRKAQRWDATDQPYLASVSEG